jgi:hypothetical protein
VLTVTITVRSTRPVSESELARVEASLGVSIPDGYRTFLQATDGGRPVEDTFSPKVGVTNFLGARGILKQRARLRGRIPENLLPIADAEGGNLICISVAEGDVGAIYFWDHELEGEKAAERLEASFDDFVSKLRVLSREDLPSARVISVQIDPDFLKMVREQEEKENKRPSLRWPR